MPRPDWIEIGKIARVHGVQGEVRIMSVSDNPERFVQGSVMFARPQRQGLAGPPTGERRQLTVEHIRGTDDFPIVAFREIESCEAAEALRGYVLEIQGSQLPVLAPDEFYPFDLMDLEVRTLDGSVVGRVADVVESPAHGLIVVALDTGSAAGQNSEDPQLARELEAAVEMVPELRPEPTPVTPFYASPEPGRGPVREVLVPFVSEAVPVVDLEAGFIEVHPRYLLEPDDAAAG